MADDAAVEERPPQQGDPVALAKRWCAEIAQAEKAHSKFVERGKKIEKIYNDERDMTVGRQRKFNILWSNVETQMPAVYMQTPKAKAVRRYRDRDPVARFSGMVLERSIQTSCELYDFDHAMTQAVRDRLVPGRGQVWVFYEPSMAGEDLQYESVLVDYVPWQDFLHGHGCTWSEVPWVARRFRLDRAGIKRFIQERQLQADPLKIALDYKADGKSEENERRAQAQIWEIWDKTSRSIVFLAPGSNDNALIGQLDPPVRYRDFFPCPRPLMATTTSSSLIPTADYALYQDQAEELNQLTARIIVLQKALKVAGVYASEAKELADLIESGDNRMIAVKDWARFSEAGGVKGRIEWFPVEQVAMVLKHLYEVREQAKQTLYEVSGIGDILRGATDPTETATAQGIKAKWGSLRVRRIQKDVQRFAADIFRLKAEVLCEVFEFRSLMKMAGVDRELLAKYASPAPMPPADPNMPPEMVQQMQQQAQMQAVQMLLMQAEALLKDDVSRSFRIDVEADSTLEPDQAEEKQAAVEFVSAMTGFMEKAAPMAAQGPEAAKLVGEMLLFAVRRFDKVDQLEQTIEQAVEAASKPRPPQPDPEVEKAKADAEAKRGELQIKGQELQMRQAESQGKLGLEGQKLELEKQLAAVELRIKAKELQLKERELGIKERDIEFRGEEMGLRREEVRDRRDLEREKIADGREARRESFAEKAKRDIEEGSPPEPKEDKGLVAVGEGLKAVAEVMGRKKTMRRPDGTTLEIE